MEVLKNASYRSLDIFFQTTDGDCHKEYETI